LGFKTFRVQKPPTSAYWCRHSLGKSPFHISKFSKIEIQLLPIFLKTFINQELDQIFNIKSLRL